MNKCNVAMVCGDADVISEYTVADMVRRIVAALTPKYGAGEGKAMARFIFENLKGWSPVDLAIKANDCVSEYILYKVDSVVERLLNDEPIQYIFGVADFYGMKFKVSPATLIPRPETAELVDIIVGRHKAKDLRVIDFGTGSGCIAVSLARNLPFANVTAVDISAGALEVARDNAGHLRVGINFVQADILNLRDSSALGDSYDIIVSNPPYIAESEKSGMEKNVLDYEPASALFVTDRQPLVFYDAILDFATKALSPGGSVYFEINPRYVVGLKELCRDYGFDNVTDERDSFGKVRFIIASRAE